MSPSFLYAAARTPFGRFGGGLRRRPARRPGGGRPDGPAGQDARPGPGRGSTTCVCGNANGAGEDNRNVGRMAVLLAGLPVSVPATTVNRLCGSSLDAAMIASRAIETGDAEIVVAGGVESMTRAPWVLPKPARAVPGRRRDRGVDHAGLAAGQPGDAEGVDGLARRGNEQLQEKFGISRERQDAFAARSHQLADRPPGRTASTTTLVVAGARRRPDPRREHPARHARPEKLAGLKPAFRPDGTITAGNASPLNDGASARADRLRRRPPRRSARTPLARIAGRGRDALEPQTFGYAPVEAADRALRRAGIGWSDVGAVELNEAFAVQSLACLDAWEDRPGDRQHPRRRDRDRPPARRLRRPDPRHAGAACCGERRRALGRRGDLHRRRPGPRGRAGEHRRPRRRTAGATEVCADADDAVAGIADGSTVLVGGFGMRRACRST